MKILIIGASGYIGRHLVEELLQGEHQVVVSSRNPEKAKATFRRKCEYIQWDGVNPDRLTPHLETIDAVVNLAGENMGALKRWNSKWKKRLFDSRVITGKALAEAIMATGNKPEVLIQGSATGFYGTKANNPEGEKREKGTGFLADLTSQWEGSVNSINGTRTRTIFIRTGVVLGKDSALLSRLQLSFKVGMGIIPGGPQWVSWIHIRDLAAAIRFLLENPEASGAYNLTAPEPVTMRQFIKTIGKIRRRPAWITILPFIMKLALGEMAEETVLASQNVLPEALMDAGYLFEFREIENALVDLINTK